MSKLPGPLTLPGASSACPVVLIPGRALQPSSISPALLYLEPYSPNPPAGLVRLPRRATPQHGPFACATAAPDKAPSECAWDVPHRLAVRHVGAEVGIVQRAGAAPVCPPACPPASPTSVRVRRACGGVLCRPWRLDDCAGAVQLVSDPYCGDLGGD